MNLRVIAFSLLIVAIAYANAVPGPFVQSDDFLIVAANQGIRSIAPLRFLSEPYWAGYKFGGIYRPLTIFSFSIDYAIWHRWAPGFRLTNLLLHALNGYLVFLLASILIGSTGAWAATTVYLLHPVHTEAIVGIVGRSELLAAAFFFAAWLMFRRGRNAWAAALFLLSLLSKENAIVLPAVLLMDMWLSPSPGERMGPLLEGAPGEGSNAETLTVPSPRGRRWSRLAPMILVAAAYLALRFSVLGQLGVPATFQYMHGGLTLVGRWMTSGRAFLQYFRLILAPVDVAADYEFNSIHIANLRDWDAWAGLVAVLGCILTAVVLAKKRPAVSLAILFFFIALLPVSNWVMPISVLVAERFLYTPAFGVALLSGIAWSALPTKRAQYLLGTGVLVTSSLLCISHNWIWSDDYTFFKNMVRVTPDNLSARLGFGLVLQHIGWVGQAKEQFEAGLRIDPDSPALLSGLAGAIIQADPKHCEQTRPLLDRAFKAQPNNWQSSWVLANCYALKGDRENADASYRRAVENAPIPDPDLLFSWGTTLENLGKRDDAMDVYRRAALIDPDDQVVRRRLARLVAER
jgi:tetratricopeptide (TPR) repeat protein